MLEVNKIYNEDCLDGMKRIDDKSIDMIFTDLPYHTTQAHWDCEIDLDKMWRQYEYRYSCYKYKKKLYMF